MRHVSTNQNYQIDDRFVTATEANATLSRNASAGAMCMRHEGHVQWSDEPNTVYQRWVTVQVSVDVETSPVYPFIG